MDEEEDNDWENYDSGPFCRHFYDPRDCEVVCATCGHGCIKHDYESPCDCAECDCTGWKEPEDNL